MRHLDRGCSSADEGKSPLRKPNAMKGRRSRTSGKLTSPQAHARRAKAHVLPASTKADRARLIPPVPITVIGTHPIKPAFERGRLRLLGLYSGMGDSVECTYIGSYTRPGEAHRDHALSSSLREIDVPLSDAHHGAAQAYSEGANGLDVIDLMFSQQAHLSSTYLEAVVRQIRKARVVVFSRPWVYPLVATHIQTTQTVIYDAQDVEADRWARSIDAEDGLQAAALRNLVGDELALARRADWIIMSSQEALGRFHSLYGVSPERMRVLPNGIMASETKPTTPQRRRAARKRLGLSPDDFIGIFTGSFSASNVEAARYIANALAPIDPRTTYVIVGEVGQKVAPRTENVRVMGQVSENEKIDWLAASDFGIDPAATEAASSIKMLEFLGAGLPVVTTPKGERRINATGARVLTSPVDTPRGMQQSVEELRRTPKPAGAALAARICIEENFAWEHISREFGAFCTLRHGTSGQSQPSFSVVVPSDGGHAGLDRLMAALAAQVERDFEVIVVDQSAEKWPHADNPFDFTLTYFQTGVKGPGRARNTGAMLARGQIIAFIVDDCVPDADWLSNARGRFSDEGVSAITGSTHSSVLDVPSSLSSSSHGSEGEAFETGSVLVRSAAFHYVGGFDLQFDRPAFRYGTDLAWRLQEIGAVLYARDVRVCQTALPESGKRSPRSSPTNIFKNDAKLYLKNPKKYQKLFECESNCASNPSFIFNLVEGFRDLGRIDDVPDWILKHQ
jgi:glycosyltransferase involved in cell wall biosynthesis